ncbi:MAG: PASTA domain-containing protein [Desulfotomaculum sp.]|nr:PASTA domain-containing protein [Desulfotomaculum sp.]
MTLPDVLGLPLEAAVKSLQVNGWQVNVQYTNPPFPAGRGAVRVVRVNGIEGNVVYLTASYEVAGKGV